ncbi:hypothetical protein GGR57DRAFT_298154 [Xylariaceae sp. FL1272]|nr:hypothetical protein GGR57DRAFT_298154 [Xylariaceae sp. FL1272]
MLHTYIAPLTFQASSIGFRDWVSLLTLSLAPLIAHIVAGCPTPSLISSHRQPKWHDNVVHYNPTSIIWRYALIADRRFRAKTWGARDMAAAHAIFWTSHGWDGSEAIALASTKLCARIPESSIIDPLSGAMVKTIITTLQGVQAFVVLFGASIDRTFDSSFTPLLGVDLVFWPLSIIGLVRLCSALWLTDYYFAAEQYTNSRELAQRELNLRASIDSLLDLSVYDIHPSRETSNFHPPSHWLSCAFRPFFFSVILSLSVLSALYTIRPPPPGKYAVFTVTSLIAGILYFLFSGAATCINAFYLLKVPHQASFLVSIPFGIKRTQLRF